MRTIKDKLKQEMEHALDYQTWVEAASALDHYEGKNEWKCQGKSSHYNYKLIQQRLQNLREYRLSNDIHQLAFILREGLQRNLGNINNLELYNQTHVGTKLLIDEYIQEVVNCLEFLCYNTFKDFAVNEKIKFFHETNQSFGRTSLLLSGGATLGLFHIGVIKALWEQKLLPRVISGSSVGSVIASVIGSRTDEELPSLFDIEDVYLTAWRRLDFRQMWDQKALMDNTQLKECIIKNTGDITFQESYERSRRMINIPVTPVIKNQMPRLLNYLTSPHLLVWSATMASCAVPGLFPPVTLTAKDYYGNLVPYMSSVKWADGSIKADLPMRRLSELYDVNHYIVSQTNPHVIPFISEKKRRTGLLSLTESIITGELQYRSKQILSMMGHFANPGIMTQLIDGMYALVDQQYYGNVTVYPTLKMKNYMRMISNISKKEVMEFIHMGERATWPKISMIRNQTKIGQSLESCLEHLKFSRNRRRVDATTKTVKPLRSVG